MGTERRIFLYTWGSQTHFKTDSGVITSPALEEVAVVVIAAVIFKDTGGGGGGAGAVVLEKALNISNSSKKLAPERFGCDCVYAHTQSSLSLFLHLKPEFPFFF